MYGWWHDGYPENYTSFLGDVYYNGELATYDRVVPAQEEGCYAQPPITID